MGWVASRGFVGRHRELRALADLLGRIRSAEGGAVLLGGEPGIGKSRLAEEVSAHARDGGFRVAWGRCRESEGAPPYWPWQQVLRALGARPLDPDAVADTAGSGRFRLFEHVTSTLAAVADGSSVLLILDDVHRADDASMRLLAFVTDQLRPARLGFVLCYRDAELRRTAVPAAVVAELARERRTDAIVLDGLSVEEVRDWLELSSTVSADVSGRVHERTGGNPLFVGEVVRQLTEGRSEHTPPSVRELIKERAAVLPEQTRRALEVAAVLGREFGYPPLAAALRKSPLAAVETLTPAVDAQLIMLDDVRGGEYRFAHALIRDAVLAELAPAVKARLHALALSALQDTGRALPSDIAEHAVRARAVIGDDAALAFVVSAAEHADRLLAWEDAAAWWQAAVELMPLVGSATALHPAQLRLGAALLRAGQVESARECFETAAARAAAAGDDAMLARAALGVGETVAEIATDVALVRLLDDALSRAGIDDGDRVLLEARRAIAAFWSPGGPVEARERSRHAVSAARRCGDDRALGAALVARQFTLRGPDLLAERIEAGAAVGAIADRLADDELRFRAHQWLIPDLYQAGDLAGARAELDAAAAIARARRDPMQRWWVGVFSGLLAAFAGRAAEAELLADEAAALGRRLGQSAAEVYAVGQLVPIFWRVGRLGELRTVLAELVPRFPGLPTLQCDLALVLAETGDQELARDHLTRLAAHDFAALPRDSLFLASLAILGEVAVSLGDRRHAELIGAALDPYADRNLIQGVPAGWGCGAWHLARMARVAGDGRAAQAYAETAGRLHRQWGAGLFGPPLGTDGTRGGDGLSPRELQVVKILALGRSNKEIASELHISVHTVERHVANIFVKLGTRNRSEAVRWAQQQRLVS